MAQSAARHGLTSGSNNRHGTTTAPCLRNACQPTWLRGPWLRGEPTAAIAAFAARPGRKWLSLMGIRTHVCVSAFATHARHTRHAIHAPPVRPGLPLASTRIVSTKALQRGPARVRRARLTSGAARPTTLGPCPAAGPVHQPPGPLPCPAAGPTRAVTRQGPGRRGPSRATRGPPPPARPPPAAPPAPSQGTVRSACSQQSAVRYSRAIRIAYARYAHTSACSQQSAVSSTVRAYVGMQPGPAAPSQPRPRPRSCCRIKGITAAAAVCGTAESRAAAGSRASGCGTAPLNGESAAG